MNGNPPQPPLPIDDILAQFDQLSVTSPAGQTSRSSALMEKSGPSVFSAQSSSLKRVHLTPPPSSQKKAKAATQPPPPQTFTRRRAKLIKKRLFNGDGSPVKECPWAPYRLYHPISPYVVKNKEEKSSLELVRVKSLPVRMEPTLERFEDEDGSSVNVEMVNNEEVQDSAPGMESEEVAEDYPESPIIEGVSSPMTPPDASASPAVTDKEIRGAKKKKRVQFSDMNTVHEVPYEDRVCSDWFKNLGPDGLPRPELLQQIERENQLARRLEVEKATISSYTSSENFYTRSMRRASMRNAVVQELGE